MTIDEDSKAVLVLLFVHNATFEIIKYSELKECIQRSTGIQLLDNTESLYYETKGHKYFNKTPALILVVGKVF